MTMQPDCSPTHGPTQTNLYVLCVLQQKCLHSMQAGLSCLQRDLDPTQRGDWTAVNFLAITEAYSCATAS